MSFYQYNDDNVSSDSNTDSESDTENKYTEYTEEFLLISNSKDRNYRNGEKTFNYNILFGTNFKQNSIDNGNNNAFFTRNYDNIKTLAVEAVLLPNLYINLDELHGVKKNIADFSSRLRKVRDLDYITMNVSGYQSNIDGTNRVISQSSNVLIVDDTKDRVNNSGDTNNAQSDDLVTGRGRNLVLGTTKDLLYMRNITDWNKRFLNSVSSLNNINVSFYEPSGRQLVLMNDHLNVSTVKVDSDTPSSVTKIILTTSKYFSPEEYSVGDNIIIRNASITGGGSTELEAFLNREEGHNIISISGSSPSNIEMYNQIDIAVDYKVNTSDGSLTTNFYGLDSSNPKSLSSNTVLLSLNNQNTIFFKISLLNRRATFTSELI